MKAYQRCSRQQGALTIKPEVQSLWNYAKAYGWSRDYRDEAGIKLTIDVEMMKWCPLWSAERRGASSAGATNTIAGLLGVVALEIWGGCRARRICGGRIQISNDSNQPPADFPFLHVVAVLAIFVSDIHSHPTSCNYNCACRCTLQMPDCRSIIV